MTITLAWERRLANYSEIIFCSDSRLTGGGNIDVCQKVFPLPREDGGIGFCGSTLIAYPIINQFISYVKNYKKMLIARWMARNFPAGLRAWRIDSSNPMSMPSIWNASCLRPRFS